jgi:hypothetical protein
MAGGNVPGKEYKRHQPSAPKNASQIEPDFVRQTLPIVNRHFDRFFGAHAVIGL